MTRIGQRHIRLILAPCMYLNRVTLIGYLARDAVRRVGSDSTPYTVLTLVTKASWKDRTGEWQTHSEYHRCIVWGAKFADTAGAFKKGTPLQIEGELRSREFQKDGVANRVSEVRIHSVVQIRQAWRETEAHPPDAETADSPP